MVVHTVAGVVALVVVVLVVVFAVFVVVHSNFQTSKGSLALRVPSMESGSSSSYYWTDSLLSPSTSQVSHPLVLPPAVPLCSVPQEAEHQALLPCWAYF